jgi:hypothetical protein
MTQINTHRSRIVKTLRRARYLVITMKGLQFIERWHTADHIPPQLTKLYQLLIKLFRMKGTMTTNLAKRLGYNKEILNLADAEGYVKIEHSFTRPSKSIQNTIATMIGEAPKWIYA